MPRRARLRIAAVPLHLIQRGNNRCACFFDDSDYALYLGHLQELAIRFRCALHAYVLMTNHVHLLLTAACEDGPSLLMKHVGQRHAQCVNRTYRRTPGRCGRAASGRASCSSTGSSCGVSVISSSTRCARVWCCTRPITVGPAIARMPAMRHLRCSRRTLNTWRSVKVTRPGRALIGCFFAPRSTRQRSPRSALP
jgi:REP element-mobilizing transposase RayT